MPYLRQAAFTGGEISPSLYGRSDVTRYHTAAALISNMIPLREGPVVTRPGTEFIHLSYPDGRLVPFVCSNMTSYMLVFGDEVISIFKAGVLQATIVSPYTDAEVRRIKFAQLGNVLTIVHASHVPYELTRTNDTTWTLAAMSVALPAASFGSGTSNPAIEEGPSHVLRFVYPQGGVSVTPFLVALGDNLQTLREGSSMTLGGGLFVSTVAQPYLCSATPTTAIHTNWDRDITNAALPWVWQITALIRYADGIVRETAPFTVTQVRQFGYAIYNPGTTYSAGDKVSADRWSGAYYTSQQNANTGHNLTDAAWWVLTVAPSYDCDRHVLALATAPEKTALGSTAPAKISWDLDLWTYPPGTTWRYVGWRVYRGLRYEDAGYVGTVDIPEAGGSYAFYDYGDAPDYTQSVPTGTNPFSVFDGTGTLVATENPTVVSFYEQRRVFAAPYNTTTGGRLGWIFASAIGDYSNFDKAPVQTADQTYSFELASQCFEEIRALLPVSKLLAFTSQSEWAVGGSGGDPLTFSNVDAHVQGNHGSSWVDPVRVGNEALFVQERGPHVQTIVFDWGTQSWDGEELNVYADHLLDGRTIVAWAWVHQPYHAVFMVMDDGTLLTMTYQKEQGVLAWARHDTDGLFVDVCTIPEGTQDAVYFLVEREGRTLLERLAPPMTDTSRADELQTTDCATLRTYTTPRMVATKAGGGTVANGELVVLSCDDDTWFAEEGGLEEIWNPNIYYYGGAGVVGDVTVYDGKYFKALASNLNEVPGYMGSSSWAQFYAYDAGVTYALNQFCFVADPGGGIAGVYKSLQAGNVGHAVTNHLWWESVQVGARKLLVLEATKADGTFVRFSVASQYANTVRLSNTDLVAYVSAQTTTGFSSGTAFTTWRRVVTHVPIAQLGGTGDTFVLSGGKFRVDSPVLRGFTVGVDGLHSVVGSDARVNDSTAVLGLGTSAPLYMPAAGVASAAVGYTYQQRLALLPPAIEGKEVRTMHVSMPRITVEMIGCSKVWVGQDVDNLQEVAVALDMDDPLAMTQTLVEARVANRWTKGAVGYIYQPYYPMKILSVIREVEFEKP